MTRAVKRNPGSWVHFGGYTPHLFGEYFKSQYKDPVINQAISWNEIVDPP